MMRLTLTASALLLALSACQPAELPPEASAPPSPRTATPASPPAPPMGPFAETPQPGEEPPTSQTTPGPIPVEFRHVWAIDPADCKADPGLTRIAIAPGAIRFYEGRAVVVKSQLEGEDKLLLDVEHMAEGQTSTERHALALRSAGVRLIYLRRGESFTYMRCS